MKSQLDGNMDQVMYYVSNYGIEEAANLVKKMYDGQVAGGRKATEYITVARATGDQPNDTADHITVLHRMNLLQRAFRLHLVRKACTYNVYLFR